MGLVVQEFVKRANRILLAGIEKSGQIDLDRLTASMDNIKADVLLYAASFKQASTESGVDFKDLKDTNFESKDSSELTPAEKDEMLRIFVENRPGYSLPLLQKTKAEFEEALESSGKKFYVIKHNNVIMSFIRFDDLGNHRLYGGSLNVRFEARGSAIGSALMSAVMAKEGEHNTIEAVVCSKNPMLKHYVDDFGCKIVGEIPDFEGTGEKYYQLERPPQFNSTPVSDRLDYGEARQSKPKLKKAA